jgi:hypothetical protein
MPCYDNPDFPEACAVRVLWNSVSLVVHDTKQQSLFIRHWIAHVVDLALINKLNHITLVRKNYRILLNDVKIEGKSYVNLLHDKIMDFNLCPIRVSTCQLQQLSAGTKFHPELSQNLELGAAGKMSARYDGCQRWGGVTDREQQ